MARTLVIGDVHGCSRELAELLALLALRGDDRVIFVGDLVARGPDSRGVLAIFREIAAHAVLGNHEMRLLETRRARLRGERGPRLSSHHERVLRELSDEDWHVLECLPLYIDLPEHAARVVHAGVLPERPFELQDAWTLTHIRSVLEDGTPSNKPGQRSWAETYSASPHLIFGHDSRRQLQLHTRATGLDTGCVYGGSLTALTLRHGQAMPFPRERRDLLVSVRAAEAYYRGGSR